MSAELEPLPPVVANLPNPREFAALLRARLESEIIRVREERGEVQAPEDTHSLVRSLQGFTEMASDYARAWSGVAADAKLEIEEELKDAVTERTPGVPLSGMDVPDADGTKIRIALDNANTYDIDVDALYPAIAEMILSSTEIGVDILNAAIAVALEIDNVPRVTFEFNDVVARALIHAMTQVPRVGDFKPQVTKVKALAAELGKLGADRLASTVTQAIRKKTIYKGIKITREQPK